MGQGKDYVYHGTTSFQGIHEKDILTLSEKQSELYNKNKVHEIYPEYWLIKVGKFSDTINDKLDEWIYFFKNAEIKNTFSAKGLKEASKRLVTMKLDEEERKKYNKYLKHLHEVASGNYNEIVDAQDLIKKGAENKETELILEMNKEGFSIAQITKITQKSAEYIKQIIDNHINK